MTDDEDWWPDTTPHVGAALVTGGAEADAEPIATLWVPDPEQRHGWREWYVKPEIAKPNGKRIGFRR